MPQVGKPEINIQEPLGGNYNQNAPVPQRVPVEANESTIIRGQTLVDDANQQTGGQAVSDLTPIADQNAKGKEQPDEPKANTVHLNVVPSVAKDANGNRIVDSDVIPAPGTTGGPFDTQETARAHAVNANGHVHDMTVLAKPKTSGFGGGMGSMSGATPPPISSDGYGSVGNIVPPANPNINRTGSRNHANLHVVARGTDQVIQ